MTKIRTNGGYARYPAFIVVGDGGNFTATFRDLPNLVVNYRDPGLFYDAAREALMNEFSRLLRMREPVPEASRPIAKEVLVELPLSLVAKVTLLNIMLEQGVRPSELARRMGVTRHDVARITDIRHTTKIDTIELALRTLGQQFVLTVV